jgi:hypothetical protein
MIPENLADWACRECGKVYNPHQGDRYWSGLTIDGEQYELLCDGCRRTLDDDYPEAPATL